MVYIIPMAIVR